MLSKQDKSILQELPKVKEELEQNRQFLEQLKVSQDTVSEDSYQQLESKYRNKIEELEARQKEISARFEQKRDELKITLSSLQKRRTEINEELNEITQLKERGAISEEDYKQKSKHYHKKLKEIDRKYAQIKSTLEEIDFYFNAKGEVRFKKNTLPAKLTIKFSNLLKIFKGGNGFNWKYITGTVLIILVITVLIINNRLGKKYSNEIKRRVSTRISNLRNELDDDQKLTFNYDDIKVNPLLSRLTIEDLNFSLEEFDYRNPRDADFFVKFSIEELKLKVSYDFIKNMISTKTIQKIYPFNLSLKNVKQSIYEDGDGESGVDFKLLKINFDGEVSQTDLTYLEDNNLANFDKRKQELEVNIRDLQINLSDESEEDLRYDDEILSTLLISDQISPQIESLDLKTKLDLNESSLKFGLKAKTSPVDIKSDISVIFNNLRNIDSFEFGNSEIIIENLANPFKNKLVSQLQNEFNVEFPKKDNKFIFKFEGKGPNLKLEVNGKSLTKNIQSHYGANDNRQAVISDMNNFASSAMAWYKTPTSHGGGGSPSDWSSVEVDKVGEWVGYGYDVGSNSLHTNNGKYKLEIYRRMLRITGIGTVNGNDTDYRNSYFNETGKVEAEVYISYDGDIRTKINN